MPLSKEFLARKMIKKPSFQVNTNAMDLVHKFRLYKESGLEKIIQKENQRLFGTNAIVLADSDYQGLSSRLPGALTPFKRKQGRLLNDEQLEFNHNIVENWFCRHKVLWAKMS